MSFHARLLYRALRRIVGPVTAYRFIFAKGE